MNENIFTVLIAASVNFMLLLLIYSFLAYALVQRAWHHHGVIGAVAAILAAQLLWIHPATFGFSLAVVNSILTASAVVILAQAATKVPRQLEDLARMDGCGWFQIYWHVLLPSVRRELALIALLIGMGMLFSLWVYLSSPGATDSFLGFFRSFPSFQNLPTVGFGVLISIILAIPVVVIFLFASRWMAEESPIVDFSASLK
jgi:ABC-type glycerol-3-phosphate transport system permease component